MLINVSPHYLYWSDKIQPIEDMHIPYFLAFPPSGMEAEKARQTVLKNFDGDGRIKKVGDIETYQSFWNPLIKRKVFKIYTVRSYMVPEVSNDIFRMGLYTAEHDIPYNERALVDLAAGGKWIFDTEGKEKKVKVTAYDIEMTKYGEVENVPIDIIGYHQFDFSFISEEDLENEDFYFQFTDFPGKIEGEVKQLISFNENDEISNLIEICNILKKSDIITGHNIIGFDNLQIYERMRYILKNSSVLSNAEAKEFKDFLEKYARRDQSFHFGTPTDVAIFYPSSFDTYQAARKFYSLDEYTLGGTASFLGVDIKDRLNLTPQEMGVDERTMLYNRQDVMEQEAITMHLLQQAMPLAFTTGMPFEILLPSGATRMWDYMAMIRAVRHKKIMPATCRVFSVASGIGELGKTKEEIANAARREGNKEIVRIAKYGDEMPDWVEYPFLIFDRENRGIAYHFPGGMTIKPDKDANSHFVPWYYVIVADVGAMYPTILRAVNAGADTVRITGADEQPDDWIWLKKVPDKFMDIGFKIRGATEDFVDKGIMVGVKISNESGLVNLAMKGMMNFIGKIKEELKKAEGEKKKRLAMIYQSLKGARNAGTHGILSAPKVSCRQFNLWGATLITTKGQQILNDTLKILNARGARVVYGDTDGIYVACSRSASERLAEALGVEIKKEDWIIMPEKALDTIEFCNKKWREKLNYQEFELEPEEHDAMIFVKHKNYLIFDVKKGKVSMVTKGNNFKGSDKPDIARMVLKDIMVDVLRENMSWDNEENARNNIKKSIKRITMEKISALDIEKFGLDAFTLVQSIQPPSRYKPNPNGSQSVYGKRAEAIEKLLGKIKVRRKFKFVITKKPLPGIKTPTKSGVKPIQYMYPVELLKGRDELDMEWYTDLIKNFIQGAFGLTDLDIKEQHGLDKWM
ncbi:MAG: DNA polymerase domain-containing protein [Candidatus Thermoplasmatota archaeon]|nr:DNA polymerase domain-containing protein [Candidatus Thermoplasmatota archaeon]